MEVLQWISLINIIAILIIFYIFFLFIFSDINERNTYKRLILAISIIVIILNIVILIYFKIDINEANYIINKRVNNDKTNYYFMFTWFAFFILRTRNSTD